MGPCQPLPCSLGRPLATSLPALAGDTHVMGCPLAFLGHEWCWGARLDVPCWHLSLSYPCPPGFLAVAAEHLGSPHPAVAAGAGGDIAGKNNHQKHSVGWWMWAVVWGSLNMLPVAQSSGYFPLISSKPQR